MKCLNFFIDNSGILRKHWQRYKNLLKYWSSRLEEETTIWTFHPQVRIKLNVDTLIRANTGTCHKATTKEAIRHTLTAAVWKSCAIEDPTMPKVIGIKKALEWVRMLLFDNIMLESDYLAFVHKWNCNELGISYIGDVIRECKSISFIFSFLFVSHVRRSRNRVADHLAHLAFSTQKKLPQRLFFCYLRM